MSSLLTTHDYLEFLRSTLAGGSFRVEDCRRFGQKLAKEDQSVHQVQQRHQEAAATLMEEMEGIGERDLVERQASLVFGETLLAFAEHLQKGWQEILGEDSQARLNLILDAAELGTWSWDLKSRTFLADERFHAMHGSELHGEVVDREDYLRRVHPADVEAVTKATFSLLVNDCPLEAQYRVFFDGESERHIRTQASVVRDVDGIPLRIFGVCLDISDRQKAQHDLEELSCCDPLTGVLNRRGLTNSLEREVDRRRRSGSKMQALLLDLDDFKKINDIYGLSVGDEVLQSVSQILRTTVRASDHVARIGGDEFLVILPNTNREEARPVADKIHQAISESMITKKFPYLRIGASLGMVSAARDDEMVEDLLVRTERVLHSAKRYGKGQVLRESNLLRGSEVRAKSFTEILEELHDPKTYFAVKQKVVRVSDEEVVGYEFLTRSHCEALRSPEDFLHFAMDAGVANIVDLHAFRTCSKASLALDANLHCHLNLLPSTLEAVHPDQLLRQLRGDRELGQYCIEISEKEAVRDPRSLLHTVDGLREAGVRIALDDIGFGHSSLEALIMLEPDVIKVDRALIGGVHKDEAKRRALASLLRVVATWGGEVVAEGVETRNDLGVLQDFQVPFAQGFLFGQPE